jgi:uncharacterized lipoprotein YddW (UPF0748 family)
MKRHLLILLACLSPFLAWSADRFIKREVRGVWMATVYGIDWPSTTGYTTSIRNKQKAEMTQYLDVLQENNFNAVYFQVRPMCDAFYKSSYEPWSSYLTGTRGRNPGWDPLAFVVEECHNRGLECHAWVNPYRWSSTASGWTTTQDRKLKTAKMLLSYTNSSGTTTIILNPALDATNERIVNVCRELIENYDIDGIIFDDYFYPSGIPTTSEAGDYDDWLSSGTDKSFGDWRRANVNGMVADVYEMIQEVDPSCKFGISPAGAACTDASVAASHGVSKMPVASDWQYNGIFSDPVAWLEEGTIDYISPQIYWKTDHSSNPFGPMTKWWSTVAKQFGRHHYASHSLTFLQSSNTSSDWTEVGKQMQYSRQYTANAAPGQIYYSACDIDGKKVSGLGEWLKKNKYQRPALTPAIDWKEAPSYEPVENLRWEEDSLTWDSPGQVRFAVYAIPDNVSDASAERSTAGGILSTYLLQTCYSNSFCIPENRLSGYRYAVSVVDRYGNEYPHAYVSEESTGLIDIARNTLDVKFDSWELVASSEADIEVFSTTGVRMMSGENCTTLSLIGLPSGIYIVKASNRNAQVTKKIYLR